MNTISKKTGSFLRNLGAGAAVLAVTATSAMAQATPIEDQLETAATAAITAVLATMGVILVAAFAIPVGKKTYRVIKGAVTGG